MSEQSREIGTQPHVADEEKHESQPELKDDSDGWDDILGSGALKKKVVRPGADVRPELGQLAKVRYRMKLKDSGEVVDEGIDMYRVGEGEVVPAMDLMARLMGVGEIAHLIADPRYAYGSDGLPPSVPPDAWLLYEVEMLEFGAERVPPAEMTGEHQIAYGEEKKGRGNKFFRSGLYEKASGCFQQTLKLLNEGAPNLTDDERKAVTQLVVTTNNNLATAYYKIAEKFDFNSTIGMTHLRKARDATIEALSRDRENIKTLFRAGQVSLLLNDLDEAREALKLGIKLDPKNRAMRDEYEKYLRRKNACKTSEKALFKNMMKKGVDSEDANAIRVATKSDPTQKASRSDDDGEVGLSDKSTAQAPARSREENPSLDRATAGDKNSSIRDADVPGGPQESSAHADTDVDAEDEEAAALRRQAEEASLRYFYVTAAMAVVALLVRLWLRATAQEQPEGDSTGDDTGAADLEENELTSTSNDETIFDDEF
eukprot:Rmarinus@m.20736